MPDLTINGHTFQPAEVFKIRPGLEQKALQAAKNNKVDEIFFRVGQDTYVAAGAGMNPWGIRERELFDFQCEKAEIIRIDDEINSRGDVFHDASEGWGLAAIMSGVTATVTILAGKVWESWGEILAKAGKRSAIAAIPGLILATAGAARESNAEAVKEDARFNLGVFKRDFAADPPQWQSPCTSSK